MGRPFFGSLLVLLAVVSLAGCGCAPSSPSAQSDSSSRALAAKVRSDFEAEFWSGPFSVEKIAVTTDAAGVKVLSADLLVPDVEQANQTIQQVMEWFETTVHRLGGLDALLVSVKTPGGTKVVDWTESLTAGTASGHWDPGITNYWFPSPMTTAELVHSDAPGITGGRPPNWVES
jgi:hypothetical protein